MTWPIDEIVADVKLAIVNLESLKDRSGPEEELLQNLKNLIQQYERS
jgi:hypothetical protein